MTDHTVDLVVVGSGPGGYVAAIRAAQLGMKTAIVERDALGGVCLNWGCIPTKALLRTSEVYTNMKHAEEFGLTADNISFDIEKVVKRSRKVAGKLSGGIGYLMKKNKITVIEGDATLAKGSGAPLVKVKTKAAKTRSNRQTRHPRDGRAGAHHPAGRIRARRQVRLDGKGGHGPRHHAEVAPRHRLGRHRH